jgi:phosphate:Na+ symporter
MVHLLFNVIGTVVWLSLFVVIKAVFNPALLDEPASLLGIAVAHTIFNVLCTILIFPMTGLLERLVEKLVPDDK